MNFQMMVTWSWLQMSFVEEEDTKESRKDPNIQNRIVVSENATIVMRKYI